VGERANLERHGDDGRHPAGPAERHVEIVDLDDGDAADLLLALDERPSCTTISPFSSVTTVAVDGSCRPPVNTHTPEATISASSAETSSMMRGSVSSSGCTASAG